MYLKFRTRFSNKSKNKDSKAGVFKSKARRSKEEDAVPNVEQVLTMTLSEEVLDTCSEVHDITQEQTNLVIFTEQQILENTLKQVPQQQEINRLKDQREHHLREVAEMEAANQQQVAELKAALERQVSQKQHLLDELKRTHDRKIAEKQQELCNMNNVLHELKQTYEQKLSSKQVELECLKAESEAKLAKKEHELDEGKAELMDTKQELVKVSSVLIGCQHELHEVKNKTFFWF